MRDTVLILKMFEKVWIAKIINEYRYEDAI